ncbi:MAG: COX15/CtaA family protein [Myxococcales bacterium]|nr:COX15/CtaA family protein [Myxococcales bacterium]
MATASSPDRADRAVRAWLWVVWGMILTIVVVGGITRLTGSGLSMVEWRPLMGALPPLSEAEWIAVFEQYKQSPQYQQVNHWMTLGDFERIFFWEYFHRLLGRLIGVVVLVPGLWFLARRRLRGKRAVQVLLAFVFGGLQGLLGWYMVKSGLVDVPAVSHYRLAAHLSLAFFVGCWILWILLGLRAPTARTGRPGVVRGGLAFLGLLTVQIVWGAFMAGTRAGYLYRTWPDMNGEYWPTGAGLSLAELTHNPLSIHAVHRHLALVVVALGVWLGVRALKAATDGGQRRVARLFLLALVAQLGLGIATVMAAMPTALASAHQGMAFLLLCANIAILHAFSNSSEKAAQPVGLGPPSQ